MKLLCWIALILSCVTTQAQSRDTSLKDKQLQYETLIKQRNNQRTVGIVLWLTGNIIGTAGIVYSLASFGESNAAAVATVAGIGMVVTGIGLLVSSWLKNKKAKALLRTKTSKIEFNGKNYFTQNSFGISIAF